MTSDLFFLCFDSSKTRRGALVCVRQVFETSGPCMKVLAAQGATFFFDQDADFVRGTSSTLRTEFIFGLPATGTDGSFAAGRDLYEELCKGAPPPAPARSSSWSAPAALTSHPRTRRL